MIEFKSVGEAATLAKFQPVINEVPIGIKTPLRLGIDNDGIFAMHLKLSDQIQDNLRNLLLTNNGERLGLYDFGANLGELSYELGKSEFDAEAIRRIRLAINKYMPFIDPRTFESEILGEDVRNGVGQAKMRIVYDVPRLGITNRSIEIVIFVGG